MEQQSTWWNWERILIGDVPIGFFASGNGVMSIKTMEHTGLSRQRAASEKFTLVRATENRRGLPVLPNEDTGFLSQLSKTCTFVCDNCGYLNDRSNKNSYCPSCGRTHRIDRKSTRLNSSHE